MRQVLIVEDDPDGHRLGYVRHLATYGLEAGWKVTVAVTPAVSASVQAATEFGGLDGVQFVEFDGPADLPAIAALTHDVRPDLTIVPDADLVATALARARWTGHGALSLLVMRDPAIEHRPTLARRVKLDVKHAMLTLAARRHRDVRIVRLRSALAPLRRYPTAPDPVDVLDDRDGRATFADTHDIAPDRFWFGIVGRIDARKSVPLVIEALATLCATATADRFGLLLAGRREEDIPAQTDGPLADLAALGVRVRLVDQWLSDDDLDHAIALCDCVVAAHPLDIPSGVVAKAAALGRRVLTAGAPTLRRDASVLPAARWTELDATAMARAMGELANIAGEVPPMSLGTAAFCSSLYGDGESSVVATEM
jgi:glycosyltransferase involved in cell wall biosynthesis